MLDETIDFKEQMIETRRRQILMGAAQVFAEKGYHKATTKEIAQAAGISEGTIYNYFGNKRELLLAMIDLIALQSIKGVFAADPPADPQEFLTMILHNRYQLAEQYGYLMAPIMAEIFVDADLRAAVYEQIVLPIAGHMEQYLQTYIDAGRIRPVDPMIITRAFVGSILVNFSLKFSGVEARYENISADEMIDQLIEFFFKGLWVPNER